MKTTLALLIAGLLFLATPMLAAADGRYHGGVQNYHQSWVKNERHNRGYYYDHHDQRRPHQYDNRRDHRGKKQLRRELRKTRQELHHVKQQIKHNHRRPYYVRPHYQNPAVVIGLPHFVFQFDW